MFSVRLGWTAIGSATLKEAWRGVVSLAAPPIPGLLARQWQLDHRSLRAQYLFERQAAAQAFVIQPTADPAYVRLEAAVGPVAERTSIVVEPAPEKPAIERPVFLIAAPRSGSTLLFELLAQVRDLWTQGGEGQGVIDGIVGLHPAGRPGGDSLDETNLTPSISECLHAGWRFGLRDRGGRHWASHENAARVRLLDKTTEHSLRVPFLARACPDARFVLLHRDARQNVSSLMKAWAHGGFARFDELPGWPRPWCFLLPPAWGSLRDAPLQTVATVQWQTAVETSLYALESLDRSRWACVDYNELIARPGRVVERLCRFLELDMDPVLRTHLARRPAVSATAITPPSAIKWRSDRELDVGLLEAVTRSTSARLRSLDSLEPKTPRPPPVLNPVRFACALTDCLPSDADSNESAGDWSIDPDLHVQFGAIPLGLAGHTRFRERFVADRPILWTRDPFTKAYRPYWLDRQHARWATELEPGGSSTGFGPAMRSLRAAGIFASEHERSSAEMRYAEMREKLSVDFAERGLCVVRNVLAKPHAAALARYYRELVAAGEWKGGDAQVSLRHGWHNESLARFFHHQLTGFVNSLAQRSVCPSYVYVSAYQSDAELSPHIDRKQCEYTLSLVFDEQGGRSAEWPLHFLLDDGPREVTLEVGDAVLFRGHDITHWRDRSRRAGLAVSTLLLHYVADDFVETLD